MRETWSLFDTRGRRKYLTEEEWVRFVLSAADMAPAIHAMCLVLAFPGCRISEALELARERIDAETSCVCFRTLKRRETAFRVVPVPRELIALLLQLPCEGEGDKLFTCCRQSAWQKVQLVMFRVQIRGIHASPKGLRHGFAMRAKAVGIPDPLLQRWMGHARLETTAIYGQAVGREELAYAQRLWTTPADVASSGSPTSPDHLRYGIPLRWAA